jgi:serine/threonine protein kinase
VHRDVKPPNTLWDPEGRVAVSDFGLAARAPTGAALLSGTCGTPGYMAPEVQERTGYDARADTWSLALSVAEMHMAWWDNPFCPPKGGGFPGWDSANFREFEIWRKGVIASGDLNASLKGRKGGKSKWGRYFGKIFAADPTLCEYMLTHMLVTNPAQRATMEQVRATMERVQGATSSGETQAKNAFRKLGGDTREKDAVFKVLDRET